MDPFLPVLPAMVGVAAWVFEGAVYRRIRRFVPASLSGALAVATSEYLRTSTLGLPVASLGLGLADTSVLGLGSVLGEHGATLLAALAGGALYGVLVLWARGTTRFVWRRWELSPVLGLLTVGLLAGRPPPEAVGHLRCLAIQPALSVADLRRLPRDARFGVNKRLTREALESGLEPDLVVWGESAWTLPLVRDDEEDDEKSGWRQRNRQRSAVMELFEGLDAEPLLLVGGNRPQELPAGSRLERTHSTELALFDRQGALLAHATKEQYIPFVEGLPWQACFPGADMIAQAVRRWLGVTPHGMRPASEQTGPLPVVAGLPSLGTAVCWDNLFEASFRRQITSPESETAAEAFVVASNEAWFGASMVRDHMLAATRWRAVESGRAILRATNAGPTVVVDGSGMVLNELPRARRGYGVLELPLVPGRGTTPYASWGYLLLPLAAALTLLLVVVTWLPPLARWRRGHVRPTRSS
jgi:apolipoprotein N-acyltransferase